MYRRHILMFGMMCLTLFLNAQRKDFRLLTGITLQKTVSRSFDFTLLQQNLFNQNASELWISSLDFGTGYRFSSRLKFELHYRISQFRNVDDRYESRNLFYGTGAYYNSFGRWSLMFRSRLQFLVYGSHFDDRYRGPIWYSRNKLNLKFRINYNWQPFISLELFAPVNVPQRKGIDQVRYEGGVMRHFTDRTKLELYLQNQLQSKRANPRINLVMGLNLYYEF